MSAARATWRRAPRRREKLPFLWLLAGGSAMAGLFAALYVGGTNTVTACMLLLGAVSIWCVKADSELLRLWRLFALAYFCVLPACQLIARDEIYLTLLPEQNPATIAWFMLNIVGIWLMNLMFIAMRSKRATPAAMPDMHRTVVVSRWAYAFALLALAALAFIYLKLGGYRQIEQLYADRLETSVTQNDPLEGLGVVQALANTAPLWVFACVMLRPWRSRVMKIAAFAQLIVLGWLSSGVFGNRQGIVFVLLFACLIYHAFVALISRRAAKIVAICVAVGGLAMIPLKFGIDYSEIGDLSQNFADQRMLQLSMGPLSFFLFRDLSRFDVQVQALDSVVTPGYTLSMGRSFVGAVAAVVPKAIWKDKPETFAREKSDIVRGAETNQSDETTLLFGMPGEFLVNFGVFGYLLSFVVVAWLIVRIDRMGLGANWRWLPVKVVSYPLPFLFFLFDSNVLAYYGMRWIVLFALPMALLLKRKKTSLRLFHRNAGVRNENSPRS
ncbi:hypothetical protein [Paraburkholderia terricola]|uniref:O-antigen polysaccharide polymerase Wzy n=1 Tax=Paraburkholderia terricola TaxID=169427 RepID=A0ABU1LTN2_9BURK|nr:hypothetical protein [Paraburkholderia terricola]MDR6410122.1 hypothetical protein [Paraburkholderia terricola]MDR6481282.1 hypothetical protein [Paraburkholderia terricola]